MSASARYSLVPLGALTILLPVVAMHLSWLVSSAEGHIEWCIPYLEPCTSISRAGRYGTAYFLFKGLMIPASVLLVFFWWANARWVQQLGAKPVAGLVPLAVIASLALLLYTLALGHAGGMFHLLRRIGVIGYMGLTFLLQVRVSARLSDTQLFARSGQRLSQFLMVVLLIGLVSVLHGVVSPENHNRWEDVYEWWLVMLLAVHSLLLVKLWKRSGLDITLTTRPPSSM